MGSSPFFTVIPLYFELIPLPSFQFFDTDSSMDSEFLWTWLCPPHWIPDGFRATIVLDAYVACTIAIDWAAVSKISLDLDLIRFRAFCIHIWEQCAAPVEYLQDVDTNPFRNPPAVFCRHRYCYDKNEALFSLQAEQALPCSPLPLFSSPHPCPLSSSKGTIALFLSLLDE